MTELLESYRRFSHMLEVAERELADGRTDAAAGLAQLAAGYAFPANAGLFCSPRLERLLVQVGRRLATPTPERRLDRGGRARVVVHVLSHAKPIGGDSRYAWRWIQEDTESCHVVVVTGQAEVANQYQVPIDLIEATARSGGFVHCLEAVRARPLEAASELRALCSQADVVALHVYPYDVIPVIALAHGCNRAKTVYLHLSDHTFWVGASVAHRVAHLRRQSDDFLTRHRHLTQHSSSQLPIPIESKPPRLSRADARRELGLDEDELLLLTIASPFKYSAPNEQDFLNLVLPVVQSDRRIHLVAIGPDETGPWAAASAATSGRVCALGRRWGNEAFYAAADVYLDSVPFSSITSLLEAGANAVPLLGLRARAEDLDLLGPGAPGLENTMIVAADAADYRRRLEHLLESATLRHELGMRTQAHIRSEHTGERWLRALRQLYSDLAAAGARGCLRDEDDRLSDVALTHAVIGLFLKVQSGIRTRQLIGEHIGALPYKSRVPISWQLHRHGLGLCYLNLLPSPLDVWLRQLGRRAKALVAA